MKLSLLLPLSLLGTLASAAPYPLVHTDSLHCRASPSTTSKIVKTYTGSADIKISCQTYGESIKGNRIWDKTSDGCYVADYYVKTGSSGFVAPQCPGGGGGGTSSNVPGPRGDDYLFRSSCGGVDPWNYYKCQCTSFVAQRINKRLGVAFTNRYKGAAWGNANTWDEAARRTGVKINSTPKPGCVAQTNAGRYGHVAWVSAVNGDTVVIEEYNWVKREGYSTRTVARSAFNYIHLTSST
ncbi:CHAP domain-containing protein [Sphaerosporella brunnea]|uniref:CHAP domain-containing protein n=1 Tax=Sphaerosporella brunnea TaxID=1250544 RepID=A0A5J5EWM8_9PEZI|nr:CHAP domain-containing protein [Sphaerosporella brunnea]